jgi:hypothetical protein
MQEELHDLRPVAVEVALEGVDVLVALLPERVASITGRKALRLEPLGMDPQRDDLLVVRAVEDPDAAGVLRPLLELGLREGRELRAARPTRVPVGDPRRLAGFHDELLEKSGLRVHRSSFGLAAGPFYHHAVAAGDQMRTTRILVHTPARAPSACAPPLHQ